MGDYALTDIFTFLIGRTLTHGPTLLLSRGLNKNTYGFRSLTTLLVKYYNDLLDRQSSGRDRDEVTYFYVGEVF